MNFNKEICASICEFEECDTQFSLVFKGPKHLRRFRQLTLGRKWTVVRIVDFDFRIGLNRWAGNDGIFDCACGHCLSIFPLVDFNPGYLGVIYWLMAWDRFLFSLIPRFLTSRICVRDFSFLQIMPMKHLRMNITWYTVTDIMQILRYSSISLQLKSSNIIYSKLLRVDHFSPSLINLSVFTWVLTTCLLWKENCHVSG